MTSALGALGSAVLAMLASIGRVVIFAANTVKHLALPPFYLREFFQALVQIGWLSLPVVGLTAFFHRGGIGLANLCRGCPFQRRGRGAQHRGDWHGA
jgi:phospholipid/cholesterol/gamma-HCH transport system permease protein